MKYQKQLKIKAYRESNEGKVSNLLKKLRESISIEDKMIKLKEKIYKQKQALTTMKDEQKRAEIEIYLKQLEQAFDNYSLEMNQKSYQTNDIYKYLEQISIIVQKIKPLEPLRDNEKQIHKNLKNLNRFEEHLLMIKCGISTQSFIAEIQRIITVVSQKRHQQIQLINSDQICKIEQQEPEEDLSIKMPINNLIDKIEQLNLDQETPTAGENLDQILENDIEPAIEKKVEKQEDHDIPECEKCSICLAKRKQYIAIPCGHFIYCKDCHMIVKSQMLCLLCRQTVWQLTKVFE
ncbi:hypothetical protein pb186bvf_005709 [Paramecium bursaria]